jgi:hypothetical protein
VFLDEVAIVLSGVMISNCDNASLHCLQLLVLFHMVIDFWGIACIEYLIFLVLSFSTMCCIGIIGNFSDLTFASLSLEFLDWLLKNVTHSLF